MEANSSHPSFVLSLIPLLIVSVVMAIVAHFLAKDKGRNVNLWTILGVIPVINFFFIWYFVGATNLRLEKKVDQLLDSLRKGSAPSI